MNRSCASRLLKASCAQSIFNKCANARHGMFPSLYRTRFASTKENICISVARLAPRVPLLATSQLRTFSQCRDLICLISLHLSVSPSFACHKQTCSKGPSHEIITNLRSCSTACWRNRLRSLFLSLAFALPFAFALGLFRTLERKVSHLLTIITFTFLELLLYWFLLRRCWLGVPHRLGTSRLRR